MFGVMTFGGMICVVMLYIVMLCCDVLFGVM